MKIKFLNPNEEFSLAMKDFSALHGFEISGENADITVKTEKTDSSEIRICKKNDKVVFYLNKEYQVFRALTILKQLGNTDFEYREPVMFETCGVMFDGSQASSLMNIESCKKMMLYLASMGYNMMMLYCEDCYDIDGEPYFGNMRPRYSHSDFKTLDNYAYSLGIELIPCIQTLGHLTEAIKRPPYAAISDRPDILMVGEDKVYALIDKMINTMSKCFRSKRIHIGLDEAWDLGLGNYLKKNGYHTCSEIMTEHLRRVNEILIKYNMRPMMWNDMFFRGKSKNNEYYDDGIHFTKDDKGLVPNGMSIIYWDYYHFDKETYRRFLTESKIICDNVIFAGCARNVRTFGAHLKKSIATTDAALAVCKEQKIKEIFATVWGDDHRESSTFAVLPALVHFAEHMYSADDCINEDKLKSRFNACTNIELSAFEDISAFDLVSGYNDKDINNLAVSRVCMWQDIMLGICDNNMKDTDMSAHYGELAKRTENSAKKYPQFKNMFEFYSALAKVIEIKQYLGIKLARLYKDGNREGLKYERDNTLPLLYERMCELRRLHRRHFFDEYKAIGWEILDIRYGGAIMRIDTAMLRIDDYLNGNISSIEEFEEERLSFSGKDGDLVPDVQTYQMLCSASRL